MTGLKVRTGRRGAGALARGDYACDGGAAEWFRAEDLSLEHHNVNLRETGKTFVLARLACSRPTQSFTLAVGELRPVALGTTKQG